VEVVGKCRKPSFDSPSSKIAVNMPIGNGEAMAKVCPCASNARLPAADVWLADVATCLAALFC
jgi:hypothetical protein